MEVVLFRDFIEDRRASMEVYADCLRNCLGSITIECNFTIKEFTPKLPVLLKSQVGIRFARYCSYPRQAGKSSSSINHILDHGYGHLVYSLGRQNTIVTVHDLIPLLRWKGVIKGAPKHRVPVLNLLSFHALKHARYLIAVSQSTKNDLVNYLQCDPDRIRVIYSGIDPIFSNSTRESKVTVSDNCRNVTDYPKRILITGSQFYKNNVCALRVVANLRSMGFENIQLLKTGVVTREWMSLVHEYGLENHIKNIGFVKREALPDLYHCADVLFFPSLYEGFGWPPLEAMACGTPVVTSNSGSLPEVVGSVAKMYSPDDVSGFTNEIKRILMDEDYRTKSIERGYQQAAKFTWEKTAVNLYSVYEALQK